MDKNKTELVSDVLIKLYDFRQTGSGLAELIHSVCDLFDFLKNQELSDADMQFLFFIANAVGIPQYYSMLRDKFEKNTELLDLNIDALSDACKTAD